jgi:PPM family protein phosphatase
MRIEIGHGTHTGLRRGHNEDTLLVDERFGLWLVADGMGGLASGEVASALARDTVRAAIEAGESLAIAIEKAHAAILSKSESSDPDRRMGSTIVAIKISERRFQIAWVGDSRIYRFDKYVLKQISHDHSYVQELVDRNLITPDEARNSPHKNLVTQALGAVSVNELRVDCAEGELHDGTQILLCSDGLTGEVKDDDIADILADETRAQDAVDALIQAALNGGGSDNITVVLLRCHAR